MIEPGQPFDLDHAVPREFGGQDDQIRPAHPKCNRRAGVAIANARRMPPLPSPPREPPIPASDFARDLALGLETADRDW